ncbi:MAG: FKBP-type peptidyl-prolyl cis-trans isomerase [Pseudomonadota bacterium]
MTKAKMGDTVRIHYTGTLSDGTQFDSSAGRAPLEFTLGAGNIISGLEREIVGMEVGAKNSVSIAAADAYGPHQAEAVQEVARDQIPAHIPLSLGSQLQASTPDGQRVSLTVVGLTEDMVTVDANHPLAGKDLMFEVELLEIV